MFTHNPSAIYGCCLPSELYLNSTESRAYYEVTKAVQGVLIECDASIKTIVNNINRESGYDIVIEDLDDEHVMIKESKVEELKRKLKDQLKDTVREAEDSGSD